MAIRGSPQQCCAPATSQRLTARQFNAARDIGLNTLADRDQSMNSPNRPTTGIPVSPDEIELLKKYRDIVMPAARLAGYDEFAKWLFTITAVIGTLGAAFSNSALKALRGPGVTVFFLAITATGLSLALAVIQRSVDIPKLNWQNLDDMLQKTEAALRTKRVLAWIAGTSFAIAILLAALAPLLTARTPTEETGRLAYSYGKDGFQATLTLLQTRGTEAQVEIIAQSLSGGILIAAQRAAADSSGFVRFDLTSTVIPASSTGVQVTIRCDVKLDREQSLVIPFQRTAPGSSGQNAQPIQSGSAVSCQ
jgi:hypothetical protein